MSINRPTGPRLGLAGPDGEGAGHAPGASRGFPGRPPRQANGGPPEPPPPAPDAVSAARAHLTSRYAVGAEELLWKTDRRPLADPAAIRAVITAARRGEATGPDLTAGFIVAMSARHDLDRLEARLFDVAHAAGMSWEAVASALNLPGARAARERYGYLAARRAEA